jgi:phosphoribosylformylglycinamidine synthase
VQTIADEILSNSVIEDVVGIEVSSDRTHRGHHLPGSLDDGDAQRAIRLAGAEPVPLARIARPRRRRRARPAGRLQLRRLPARRRDRGLAPIMTEVKDAAAKGMPVLGICNGFQMLVEAHLLPGGLIRNAHQQFIRRDQRLRVENASTAWTNAFESGRRSRSR